LCIASLFNASEVRPASGDLATAGVDPAATKTQSRTARTIADLAAEYLTKHAMVKKKSWRADEWKPKKDILPAWRHVPVKDIKRADVVALLDPIADPDGRNAPQSAVHVRRLLSKMTEHPLRLILTVCATTGARSSGRVEPGGGTAPGGRHPGVRGSSCRTARDKRGRCPRTHL
jgi:hypothetical protein